MARELILLAGLHKTATSSVQQTCAANLAALKELGFTYPISRQQSGAGRANHTLPLGCFRKDPARIGLTGSYRWTSHDYEPDRPAALEQLDAYFAAVPANVLLVAESVSVFDADELGAMKAWFESRGWTIRLLCHVRHLSSWLHSMIAQRVNGAIALSLPQAVDEYRQYGSIVRKRIETLRSVFPEAAFHSHESAVRHPRGPAGFFFDTIGAQLREPWREVRANERASDAATRVQALINEKFGRFRADGTANPQFAGSASFSAAMRQLQGPKFRLRAREVAPIVSLLHADDEWLGQALGPAFRAPPIQFDDAPVEWSADHLERLQGILRMAPEPVRRWVVEQRGRLDIAGPL